MSALMLVVRSDVKLLEYIFQVENRVTVLFLVWNNYCLKKIARKTEGTDEKRCDYFLINLSLNYNLI